MNDDHLDTSARLTILLETFKENLAHARHVENERMTFISIYLVGMGMLMDFTASSNSSLKFSVLIGLLLMLLNGICTGLLIRWNAVFKGHSAIAKKIQKELDSLAYGGAFEINRLYFVDNKLDTLRRKNEKRRQKYKEKGLKEPADLVTVRYIGTAKYFYIFNFLTYAVILVFMARNLFG